MPHAFGLRARTRDLFCRAFRKKGVTPLNKYLTVYKKGDYVDVIADGAIQRGMPHKFYHGKTGRVWNVTKHAVGVIVNKRVGPRIIPKRIHVRVEHVRLSSCREAFKDRVRANDKAKRDAKAAGTRVNVKRVNVQPRDTTVVDASKTSIEFMNPIKFRELY
jgi:large subunit ribosomal protein L21e